MCHACFGGVVICVLLAGVAEVHMHLRSSRWFAIQPALSRNRFAKAVAEIRRCTACVVRIFAAVHRSARMYTTLLIYRCGSSR